MPQDYEYLFKGNEEVLYTHKAIDFGAFQLAKHLEEKTYLPFYYNDISRLLVEANRSPRNEALFSEYSSHVRDPERKEILDNFYYPHRMRVQDKISSIIKSNTSVIQVAIHTFTPVMLLIQGCSIKQSSSKRSIRNYLKEYDWLFQKQKSVLHIIYRNFTSLIPANIDHGFAG